MIVGGTIVACASAPGHAPRAIVRLSGPETPAALARILTHPIDTPGAHKDAIRLGEHDLAGAVIRFAPGRSYTGEDGAEIQIPGHPALVRRVLADLLTVEGVRLAGPGEFTARAYMSGRLSAEQAEGVMALIASRSGEELDASRRLLSGETGERYAELADDLARCLALVEAGIDFAEEEDVVAISRTDLVASLTDISGRIVSLTGGPPSKEHRPDAARVVLAGPANAGKSTLFNALLGRERAIVSDTAGTTRDALEEPLPLGPGAPPVILVDLAGLDDALTRHSLLDASAQAAARERIESADVVLWCDPSGRFESLSFIRDGTPTLRVRTKGDLATGPLESDLRVCALDGWNLDALKRAIADAASSTAGENTGALSAVPRQSRALAEAHAWITEALAHLARGTREQLDDPELVAGALRAALDATADLAGEITPDDVLGRIFAGFCVGK